MMRNAAIAATIMTRITKNTRDRDRLGLSSELRFTGSMIVGCGIWVSQIEEILGEWPGDDGRAFQERTERRGRTLSLTGSVRYLMGWKRGTCGVVSRSCALRRRKMLRTARVPTTRTTSRKSILRGG
jgi:hypothetical protein